LIKAGKIHHAVERLLPFDPPKVVFFTVGAALGLHHVFLRSISGRFTYDVDLVHSPVLAFVAAQFAAGVVFMALLYALPKLSANQALVGVMIGSGLLYRLLLFDTEPILEIDFYRYLWDGGVLAHGYNPYLISPDTADTHPLGEIRALSADSMPVVARINYPELRTIYPPLSQLAFALAHWIAAWNLDAWRAVILISEGFSLTILILLLKRSNQSPLWASLYWWNPLVTNELINSAHMDALLVPLLLAAVWFVAGRKPLRAVASVVLAAGVKLWPLILLPLIFSRLQKFREGFCGGLVLIPLLLLFVAPVFYFGLGENSGLASYTQNWQRNSSFFVLATTFFDVYLQAINPLQAGLAARIFVVLAIATLAFSMGRFSGAEKRSIVSNSTWLIAVLFLFSPTQYPWYFVWFAPLLCLYPVRGLLWFTPLLSLYYLQFYFAARNQNEIFDNIVVWIQFVPVWVILSFDYLRSRRFASSV
jgi:alpha-1,6-mannosyltransferase